VACHSTSPAARARAGMLVPSTVPAAPANRSGKVVTMSKRSATRGLLHLVRPSHALPLRRGHLLVRGRRRGHLPRGRPPRRRRRLLVLSMRRDLLLVRLLGQLLLVAGRVGRGLRRALVHLVVDPLHALLELHDPLTQAPPHLGQPPPEQQQ